MAAKNRGEFQVWGIGGDGRAHRLFEGPNGIEAEEFIIGFRQRDSSTKLEVRCSLMHLTDASKKRAANQAALRPSDEELQVWMHRLAPARRMARGSQQKCEKFIHFACRVTPYTVSDFQICTSQYAHASGRDFDRANERVLRMLENWDRTMPEPASSLSP